MRLFTAQTITGVETYYILRHNGRKIHFLGENHAFGGNIADLLPSNGVVLCELEKREMFKIRGSGNARPIAKLVKRYLEDTANCPEVIPVDIRRDEPYALLEVLYMPDSFMYLNSHYFNGKKSLLAIRRRAKAFEKEVFSHINTRIKMDNFILELIHPDRGVPRWYLNWCLAFDRGTESVPMIKNRIGLLPAASRDMVTAFIREKLDILLMDQSDYSSAMRSADRERGSNSEHFVLGESELNQFFMVLFGLLLDVSILVNILELGGDAEGGGPLIVLAGDGHVYNIVKWLVKNGAIIDEQYTKNALGYITLDEPVYTRNSPQNPLQSQGEVLKAFRNRGKK